MACARDIWWTMCPPLMTPETGANWESFAVGGRSGSSGPTDPESEGPKAQYGPGIGTISCEQGCFGRRAQSSGGTGGKRMGIPPLQTPDGRWRQRTAPAGVYEPRPSRSSSPPSRSPRRASPATQARTPASAASATRRGGIPGRCRADGNRHRELCSSMQGAVGHSPCRCRRQCVCPPSWIAEPWDESVPASAGLFGAGLELGHAMTGGEGAEAMSVGMAMRETGHDPAECRLWECAIGRNCRGRSPGSRWRALSVVRTRGATVARPVLPCFRVRLTVRGIGTGDARRVCALRGVPGERFGGECDDHDGLCEGRAARDGSDDP